MTTEGHGHNCWLCHEPINALSGNPGLWPTPLIGDGTVRWWHMGCATKRMNLACWCSKDGPCHADVLLKIANA